MLNIADDSLFQASPALCGTTSLGRGSLENDSLADSGLRKPLEVMYTVVIKGARAQFLPHDARIATLVITVVSMSRMSVRLSVCNVEVP